MTCSDQKDIAETAGFIKWFDPIRGFGFIVSDNAEPDILLHSNVLRNFGQNSIADRSRVCVRVQPTARGLQAVEVLSIEPPERDPGQTLSDLAHTTAEDLEQISFRPARVKWFDPVKGFGFANLFGTADDVFLHGEIVRQSGFADLSVGEAVAMRVVTGQRGLMAAQIAAWDRGLTQKTSKE